MRWLLPVAILALLGGCSGTPTFARSRDAMTVDPGTFEEVNLEMKAGDTLDYNWFSTGTLYFNIHSHNNGQVINWKEVTGKSSSGVYKADVTGGVSLLWENKGTSHVSLTYTVSGKGTVV